MFKKIGFDIDGCIMSQDQFMSDKFLELHLEMTGNPYRGRILFNTTDIAEMFPDCENQEVIHATEDCWMVYARTAPFDRFVKPLFTKLKNMGILVDIVTARNEENEEKLEELRFITEGRFRRENIPFNELHIGFHDKLPIIKASGIELMVEDNIKNILQISEHIPVFKVTRPYNKILFGSNIYSINSLYPDIFIEKMKFADSHRNYLGIGDDLQEKEAIHARFTVDGDSCIINPHRLADRVPYFVVPLSGEKPDEYLIDALMKSSLAIKKINLGDIDKERDNIKEPIVRNAIDKYADGIDIRATAEMDSKTYILRSKVISDILQHAIGLHEHVIVIGAQILQLERDELEKYAGYPFYLPDLGEARKKIIIDGLHKKDYSVPKLFEDLDEVSMNVRKLKIIAGTDPKRLPTYINRQYFSSDGIDTVTLLKDERPYNLENLMAALSPDMYILTDPHLNPKDKEKTNMIINNVNIKVMSTGKLLILGDFDAKGHTDRETIARFIRSLSCKDVFMLVGNNDGFSIRDYIDMGIQGITDTVTFKYEEQDVVLSHCPVPVTDQQLNIHGHLHGGREYWNIDWRNHIDAWSEDYIPMTIRDIVYAYNMGYYKAKSVNLSYT